MSKKLVIKGADFSANGFSLRSETEQTTDLFLDDGAQYVYGSAIASGSGVYFYERNNAVVKGNYANYATNPHRVSDQSIIDVEDYTKVTYQGRLSLYSAPNNIYLLYIGFLDSSRNLIGGVCNAPIGAEGFTSECIGPSSSVIEFTRDIPSGCKYIIASCQVGNTSVEGESFKLTLSKEVLDV